jgi:hypothetical protein
MMYSFHDLERGDVRREVVNIYNHIDQKALKKLEFGEGSTHKKKFVLEARFISSKLPVR